MSRRKVDAGAVVFALLVVATVAAFAYAQRVKRDPLLLDRVGIGGKKSNDGVAGSSTGTFTQLVELRTGSSTGMKSLLSSDEP